MEEALFRAMKRLKSSEEASVSGINGSQWGFIADASGLQLKCCQLLPDEPVLSAASAPPFSWTADTEQAECTVRVSPAARPHYACMQVGSKHTNMPCLIIIIIHLKANVVF